MLGQLGHGWTFATFLESLRVQSGFGLRAFCAGAGFDKGFWSRLETGASTPPRSSASLARIADAVCRTPEQRVQLLDLAAKAHGQLPSDLADDPVARDLVFLLARRLRGAGGDASRRVATLDATLQAVLSA